MREEVHVACPCCKNKRLFDADPETEGIIKIKCPICKAVVAVSFHKKTIRTAIRGSTRSREDLIITKMNILTDGETKSLQVGL